jgi:hypothetical protein
MLEMEELKKECEEKIKQYDAIAEEKVESIKKEVYIYINLDL